MEENSIRKPQKPITQATAKRITKIKLDPYDGYYESVKPQDEGYKRAPIDKQKLKMALILVGVAVGTIIGCYFVITNF